MVRASTQSLERLAAVCWYIGGGVLLVKAGSLLFEASALRPGSILTWLAPIVGLAIGSAQARFLFVGSCRRNLDRIRRLRDPKIWQFFRPWFFLALFAMIAGGAALSRSAHGNYPFLLGVSILDISIGVALLGSSPPFWRRVVPDADG